MGKNNLKKISKKNVAMIVILVVAILAGMVLQYQINRAFTEKKVTVQYVSGKLENIGELATQKVTYTSEIPIEQGTIPFVTKKGFTMRYNAEMKAGIEFKDIEVHIKDKFVIVEIPHAKVISNHVIDVVEFKDQKHAIFNWDKKEDVTDAIKIAEEDYKTNDSVDESQLKKQADKQTQKLIKGFLDGAVAGKEIIISYK